jgi:uncharacterized protein YdeI (YjbR/CyaY-like superfamily)
LEPVYFKNPAALRRWFARHGATEAELIVGFMKVGSGEASVTWPESVDEALCVGWIDGVRHRIDDERYKIRFTPRRAGSHWSAVNIRRVAELEAEGRMQEAGMAAFARRRADNSATKSYEQEGMPAFSPAQEKRFRQDAVAWAYFEAVPPGYRKQCIWWVVSAKQTATQEKRLLALIDACAKGKRL